MTLLRSFIDWIAVKAGYIRASAGSLQKDAGTREALYAINQLMYDGTVYYSRQNGGCLEDILQNYCNVLNGKGRIIPHFLPVREIVDFYGYVLPGVWGKELKPVQQDAIEPVDPAFEKTLTTIWRDSNLDSEKARVIRMGANFGTVGLRVSRLPGTERVVIQPDDPVRIFNPEEDAAGNVVSVVLKYKIPVNRGTALDPDYEDADVIEIINKDEFSRKINGQEQVPDDDRRNVFGFCPYVLLRHKDNGTQFGDHAYKGSEAQIHDINWRLTQQGRSINRHQFPIWFFTAGGEPPTAIDLGNGETAQYTKTAVGTPPPSAEAIVPKIDQKAATDYVMELMAMLRGRQPELNFNDVKLMSGLSGETIAQILKPAESAVLSVRPNYDHAFIRAMQMAVSIRVDLGLPGDMKGTGDELYKSGKLAFNFAPRAALPQTVYQQQQQTIADNAPRLGRFAIAKAAQGLGADSKTVLLEAGYTDEEADEILGRKASIDVTENADL